MLKRIRELLNRRGKTAPSSMAASAGASPRAAPTPVPADSGQAPATLHPAVHQVHQVHQGPRVAHMPIPESDLDADAVKIVRRLTRFDHTAYFVGGCVRDLLLGLDPKDFDIATTATPRQVRRLFSNCRIIGRRFRLAHVYFQSGKIVEVATFRARDVEDDIEPPDGDDDILIRDDNVFGTPEEDALRRDFTINALFYDVTSGNVIDHADGLADLRRRLVRTIGEPAVRFREDPIRILRAIKFAARLDLQIEPATLDALRALRREIPKAAPPRVLEEINRFCRGAAGRRSFELLRETGVFEVVFPELETRYRDRSDRWDLLLDLMRAMDAMQSSGRDADTGTILAALLLPPLFEEFGWTAGGAVQVRRGLAVRDLADAILRPISVRLRVSRRDQEHARQILLAVHRMVPARQARRALVQALLRRPAFRDALAILAVLASRSGGAFAEALGFWSDAAARGGKLPAELAGLTDSERPPGPPGERANIAAEGDVGTEEREQPTRRRRRRSRRRRSPGMTGERDRAATPPVPGAKTPDRAEPPETFATPESVAKPPRARRQGGRGAAGREGAAGRPGLPPPWDDNYFFAALPTVPDLDADDEEKDRYGASTLTRAETSHGAGTARGASPPPHDDEAAPADDANGGAPARKGRRRRRSRRRKPGSQPIGDPEGG